MKKLFTLALILFSLSVSAQKFLDFSGYKVGWKQGLVWTGFAIAGAAHGGLEAYHAEPTVFETCWSVELKSFWGSEAWQRNYADNTYPGNHKEELFGNVGRDFWHTGRFAEKTLLIGGSFTLGIGKRKTKFKIADILIGSLISTVFAKTVYASLR